ncbi:MAG: hypothetical protein J1E81_03940 [Eubacterium sp.]|nr:hypothetical protein [Eubacterium sp.]
MADIEELFDYVLNDSFFEPIEYFYDKVKDECVCEEDFSTKKFKEYVNSKRLVKLPQVSYNDLHIEFVEAFNNKRANDYLNLFDENDRYTGAHRIIFSQGEKVFASEGDFEYFCYTRIIPIVKNWAKENGIEITVNIKKPDNYILDSPQKMERIVIPTDGVRLRALIGDVTLENMYFDRRTYQAVDDEKANKAPYLDCVKMPYIPEETIYRCFLEENNLIKEKEQLEKEANFGVAFRWFIDYNPKYDHALYNEYYKFEKQYLKPYIIDWCNEYGIKYIDDLEIF